MAIYTVKLVDRRSSGSHEMSAIQKQVERVLGLAFVDTSDSVSVSWGAGAESDNLVMHFVEDISNSYLRKTWPNIHIDPNAGGHTHSHHSMSGTELYRTRASGPLHLRQYGFMAFHEALHNLFPWRDDVHTAMGDGLAKANVPNEDPNEANKDWLRRGFAVRNPQVL